MLIGLIALGLAVGLFVKVENVSFLKYGLCLYFIKFEALLQSDISDII